MGLSREGFLRRLHAGKAVNCVYRRGEHSGLISAWAYERRFILTWEECRDGDINNEHAYTRDEKHELASPEEVLTFIEQNGYQPSDFEP